MLLNTNLLKSLAVQSATLPHALLLHGRPGIGKLALAEAFAQFLLCEGSASNGLACGQCKACRWFLAGNHPDFRRLEPEALAATAPEEREGGKAKTARPSTEIKVDQVRELADFVHVGSHRGRRRIALVRPAEDMNLNAANALLKSLEEPPPTAMFLLVSHRPERLLPTVRSRCVAIPVPPPEAGAAQAWLEAQGVKDAARLLAFSGGAPLRANAYAEDGRGEAIAKILAALQSGDRAGAQALAQDREGLELLAEALQKFALDRACEGAGLAPLFATTGAAGARVRPLEWLHYARRMGRHRLLAEHPLNPKLFAAEMLAGLPGR